MGRCMGYNIVYKYVNEDKTSVLTKYLLYILLLITQLCYLVCSCSVCLVVGSGEIARYQNGRRILREGGLHVVVARWSSCSVVLCSGDLYTVRVWECGRVGAGSVRVWEGGSVRVR